MRRAGVLLAILVALAPPARAENLLPPLASAKLHFGTGRAATGKPELDPRLPALPGPASGWFVAQWGQDSLMTPESLTRTPPGGATYGFTAPDGHAHVFIFDRPAPEAPAFTLFERGGTASPGGGSNIFLSADLTHPVALDRPLDFTMQARITEAAIRYEVPTAAQSGAVLGMAFTGFGLNFPNPQNGRPSVLFLQVGLANSRAEGRLLAFCRLATSGGLIALMGGTLSGQLPLAFRPDAGPLTRIAFRVNDYVDWLRHRPLGCLGPQGMVRLSLAQLDPAGITLRAVYIGLETQNRDARPGAVQAGPQGDVALGLQIAAPRLTTPD